MPALPTDAGVIARFFHLFTRIGYLFADYAKWGLLISIFFFKFLEWYASTRSANLITFR